MKRGWSTPQTSLAASLGALGFPVTTDVRQDDPSRTGKVETHFFIGEQSLWHNLHLQGLLTLWRNGELEKEDPMHPLLQGLRAHHNKQWILDAQHKGRRIRLIGVADSHASIYTEGEEAASLVAAEKCVQTTDLDLAAALGTLGIPVIQISGSSPRHTYTLPNLGHWLKSEDGIGPSDASYLMRRKPGSFDLALEEAQPKHPIVAAYNALAVYSQIKKHLDGSKRLIILRPKHTQRTAVISENASGRVMDKVERHLSI